MKILITLDIDADAASDLKDWEESFEEAVEDFLHENGIGEEEFKLEIQTVEK